MRGSEWREHRAGYPIAALDGGGVAVGSAVSAARCPLAGHVRYVPRERGHASGCHPVQAGSGSRCMGAGFVSNNDNSDGEAPRCKKRTVTLAFEGPEVPYHRYHR